MKTGGGDYWRRVPSDTSGDAVTDVERQLKVSYIIPTKSGSTLAQMALKKELW